MGFTSHIAKMRRCGYVNGGVPRRVAVIEMPVKIRCLDGMDCARAAPMLKASKLPAIPVPRWRPFGTILEGEADGEVYRRYDEDGYLTNLTVLTVFLGRNLKQKRRLCAKNCDWDNVDVTGYVWKDGYLNSLRFIVLLVEQQAMRITVGAKSRCSIHGAWKTCMVTPRMPNVCREQSLMFMYYLKNRD